MKLRYTVDNKGNKKYTLKNQKDSKEAHYKFVKIRDVKTD